MRLPSCEVVELPDFEVADLVSDAFLASSTFRVDKLSGCWVAGLPSCEVVELPDFEVVGRQVAF